MESEEPFGDEMPNFDICGTLFKELFKDIDVLDINAKTETATSIIWVRDYRFERK